MHATSSNAGLFLRHPKFRLDILGRIRRTHSWDGTASVIELILAEQAYYKRCQQQEATCAKEKATKHDCVKTRYIASVEKIKKDFSRVNSATVSFAANVHR